MISRDCSALVVGSKVCVDNRHSGVVVAVFAKYVEVNSKHDFYSHDYTRRYARRDGYEWGGVRSPGFGVRSTIEPWDEEKHAPLVARHELLTGRRMIPDIVQRAAPGMSMEQIEQIKAVISGAKVAVENTEKTSVSEPVSAAQVTEPLQEEEIRGMTCECVDDGTFDMSCAIDFARAIEAALKEKNKCPKCNSAEPKPRTGSPFR